MTFIRPAVAAALLGLGLLAAAPASAAPLSPAGIERPDPGVENVRMTRRGMRSRRMMRGGMMRNRMHPSNVGNARNPSRSPMQQNQGMTTGGPRY